LANGKALRIVAALLVVMLALQLGNALLGFPLGAFGLQPRSAGGVAGVFLSPFLHGPFGHLLSSAIPYAVLSMLTLGYGIGRYATVEALVLKTRTERGADRAR